MLSWRVDSTQAPQTQAFTPLFLQAFIPELYGLVAREGREVEPSGARPGLHEVCSLQLTLPTGFSARAPSATGAAQGSDEDSGSMPMASQRFLELCIVRRGGTLALWESPLITEQRSEAFLFARRHAEEDAESATVWRLPPIDCRLLFLRAVCSLQEEGAELPPALRAFRRKALDLAEQRERVRTGGEAWTRQEQLKLLCSLRTSASQLGPDKQTLSVDHAAVMAAFEEGERVLGGGVEGAGEEEGQQEEGEPLEKEGAGEEEVLPSLAGGGGES